MTSSRAFISLLGGAATEMGRLPAAFFILETRSHR